MSVNSSVIRSSLGSVSEGFAYLLIDLFLLVLYLPLNPLGGNFT